jgi:hypothetical protein
MNDWQPVDSSAIAAVKHDGAGMHIRYTSGKEYVHAGVSAMTFHAFLKADSKGRYFNTHIARRHPGRLVG